MFYYLSMRYHLFIGIFHKLIFFHYILIPYKLLFFIHNHVQPIYEETIKLPNLKVF